MVRSVSVIVPVYNHADTVGQAIDSALSQEFDGSVEIIATNDGSTDHTQQVLDSYGSHIKVVRQTNRGNAAARNAAVAEAQGEYLAFLDADDIWLPGRLSKTVAALESNPKAVLAFSEVIPMNENGELEKPWVPPGGAPSMEALLSCGSGWVILPSATTMRRTGFDACGGFPERLSRLVDCYFWLLAREQGQFEYVAEPLIIYRTTAHARLADKNLPALREYLRLMRERYGTAVARRRAADTARGLAGSLISKASIQRRNGAKLAALWTLARATWLMPSYSEKLAYLQALFRGALKKPMRVH